MFYNNRKYYQYYQSLSTQQTSKKKMPTHKYEMGVIGNCSYLAYINTKADVKWMCVPRFDSSFIFGSLLDEEKGGHFYAQPSSPNFENSQYYIENTNVL